MRRSLGIISGAFALRNQPFARSGHVVFSFFDCHFDIVSDSNDCILGTFFITGLAARYREFSARRAEW
jgi:hypothetical protein